MSTAPQQDAALHEAWIPVTGESMRPFLLPNDKVYVVKVPYRDLREDDIILIRLASSLLVHRIVYKTDSYAITKGDNRLASDGRINAKKILGRITAIKRKGAAIDLQKFYAKRHFVYLGEMTKLARMLQIKHIRYLFLKGPPVNATYDLLRTNFADCDILIDKKKRRDFERILLSLGYQGTKDAVPAYQKRHKQKTPETTFVKMVGNVPVILDVHFEIHFTMAHMKTELLFPQQYVEDLTELFFANMVKKTVGDMAIYVLRPEELVVYLALHFFHHNYKGGKHLYFMKTVLQKHGNIRYTEIEAVLRKFRIEAFVYPAFQLIAKAYRVSSPSNFMQNIKPGGYRMIYISKFILPASVYDDVPRLENGVKRFQNLFILSGAGIIDKIKTLLSPSIAVNVAYFIFSRL